jgi:L-fucose isomerase-like protein
MEWGFSQSYSDCLVAGQRHFTCHPGRERHLLQALRDMPLIICNVQPKRVRCTVCPSRNSMWNKRQKAKGRVDEREWPPRQTPAYSGACDMQYFPRYGVTLARLSRSKVYAGLVTQRQGLSKVVSATDRRHGWRIRTNMTQN